MTSSRVADLAHLSASCPVLSPSKRNSPDKTSDESSPSDGEEIPRASKKQRLFARKLTQRDRKREKEQQKKHENNAISMDDFFKMQTEFRMWLTEEKRKKVGELRSPKLKAYFKTFIKLWNKKKLAQKYYRGSEAERPITPLVPKFRLAGESTPGKDLVLFPPPTLDLSLEQQAAASPCLSDRPLSTFGKTSPETPEEGDKENLPSVNLLNSGQLSDSVTLRRRRKNTPGSTPVKGNGGSLYKVTQLSWTSQGELHVRAVSPGSTPPPSQDPCPSPSSSPYVLPPHHTPTLSLAASPTPSTRSSSRRQAIHVATPTLPRGALVVSKDGGAGDQATCTKEHPRQEQDTLAPAVPPKPAGIGLKKVEIAEDGTSLAADLESPWSTGADGGQSSSGVSSAGSSLSVASAELDPAPPGMVRMSRVFVFPDVKSSQGRETTPPSEATESMHNGGPVYNHTACISVMETDETNNAEGKTTSSLHSTIWSCSATYTEIAERGGSETVTTPSMVRKTPGTPKARHGASSITMGSAMLCASPETFACMAGTTAFERNTPTRGSLIKTVPPRPNPKTSEASASGLAGPPMPAPPADCVAMETSADTWAEHALDKSLPPPPPPEELNFASFAPRSPATSVRSVGAPSNPDMNLPPPRLGPYADVEAVWGAEARQAGSGAGGGPYAEPFDSCLGGDRDSESCFEAVHAANHTGKVHFSSFGKAAVTDLGGAIQASVKESGRQETGSASKSAVGKFGRPNSKAAAPPKPPPKPPLRTSGRESMKRRPPQQSAPDPGAKDVYAVPMKKLQNSRKQPVASAHLTPAGSAAKVTSPPPPLPPKNKIYVIPQDITGNKITTAAQVHRTPEGRPSAVPEGAVLKKGLPPIPSHAAPSLSAVSSSSGADLNEPTHFWMRVTPPSGKSAKDVETLPDPGVQQMSPIIEVSPAMSASSSATPSENRERKVSGKREKESGSRDKDSESRERKEGPGKRTPPFSRDLAFVDKFLKRAAGALKSEKGKKAGATPSPANPCSPEKKTRQADRQENPPDPPTPTGPPPSTTPPPLRGVLKYGLLSKRDKEPPAAVQAGGPRGGGRLRVGTDATTSKSTATASTSSSSSSSSSTSSPPLVRGRRYHREQLEKARELREQEQRNREQRRRKLRRSVSHDDLAGFPLMKLETSPRQAWRENHQRLQKNRSACTLID